MTKNQKIVLGVGAVVVFFYVYMKNKWYKGFSSPTDPNNPRTPTNPNNGGVVTPINNTGDSPKLPPITPNSYKLKEDFSQKYSIGASATGVATFKKGQIINASRNPYTAQKMAVGMGSLTTTSKGELPNFQISGQAWINIPESILEKL